MEDQTTIYIKLFKGSDEVTVTFANGDVLESTKMTRDELVKYMSAM